ncbi:MAG: type II toxin-antitoxin system VapB family antitoxin [Gammaproteobacteria bacterium]|nr:type II toxin-antitoxin system VapB family antitoxin [Gammaproteobacteria bacterium]
MYLNIQVEDALLQEAVHLGNLQTPQTLMLEALREYIQRRKLQTEKPSHPKPAFQAVRLKTKGFRFDREEANAR